MVLVNCWATSGIAFFSAVVSIRLLVTAQTAHNLERLAQMGQCLLILGRTPVAVGFTA